MPGTSTEKAIRLATPVKELTGVGSKRAQLLGRLGLRHVSDLIRHLPMRYEHESAEGAIELLQVGVIGSARGVISAARYVPGMGGGKKGRFEATLEDETGRLSLTWFNAGYLRDRLMPGVSIRVQGKVALYGTYRQMVNPKWEPLDEADDVPARGERLRPVYPATEDLPSSTIEQIVAGVLPSVMPLLKDPLPRELLENHAMPELATAFRMAHQPEDQEQAKAARRRLAFNEFLLLQLGISLRRAYVENRLIAPALKYNEAIDEHIRARFPFELTRSQSQVIREIAHDLARPRPMNRLLQGDVGSGKTVVALFALLMAVADGRQGALMAPTELLAEQHYLSLSRMLEGAQVRFALLTGAQPPPSSVQRKALLSEIAAGEVDLLVGTHALLTDAVRFKDLAVVVIDEQHRFGVEQRAAFRSEGDDAEPSQTEPSLAENWIGSAPGSAPGSPAGSASESSPPALSDTDRRRVPHHLVMTATPIPRTLSLTVFGDLDVSTISELPPGRTPITNRVVGSDKADDVYRYLRTRLERGEQAYVVVPAIDATGQPSATQLKSVREHAKLLQDKFCQGFRVAAVHGRLKRTTREQIMDRFRRGEIHVLVATTVIEVGVDVPNATVMIIEHAERFGLAQLHQLRGRVGRGSDGKRSLCVFISEPMTDDAHKRIEAIAATNDGFKIAEMDLAIRGMGDFFGTRQHGLPPLRVARVPEDMDLLLLARRDAEAIIQADPHLAADHHHALRRLLMQNFGEAMGLIDVG